MSIKNLTPEHKLTLQLVLAVFLTVAGVVLLFMGFWAPPIAEISPSVLTAFGEISTFSAACLGMDYKYQAKIWIE